MSSPVVESSPRDRLFHLRPVFTMRYKARSGLLEIAPWADVFMLLLMIFIAHTAVLRKPGVSINLPAVSPNTAVPYAAQVLTALEDDVFFFDDRQMDRNGLAVELRESLARDASGTLLIEADTRLSYQSVMRVYTLAVEAGWKNIVLATRTDDPAGQGSP